MSYPVLPKCVLKSVLPAEINTVEVEQLKSEIETLSAASQYGWGHTINFGPFGKEGLLKDSYLNIAGGYDLFKWWPARLDGMVVADVGCFTGGMALLMAERGAATIYAVDEIPEHIEQCALLARTFDRPEIKPVLKSVFRLEEEIPRGSLDLIVLSGVLYLLSDMLVGLYSLRQLLKPGGVLLLESNGVDDFSCSYANFGRFYGGMWWQPTGRCIIDMCQFMGFEQCEVNFYLPDRCLARATRSEHDITFRRGLNWPFSSLRDLTVRGLDPRAMAPAPVLPSGNP